MSGIVGIFHLDGATIEEDLLRRMTQRMAHRGPDAQTIWMEQNVGLGHALYKTYEGDIQQPFTLGHVTITAHVRIDSRDELVHSLQVAGIEAKMNTPDVELLTQAYLAWGEQCLNHLYGDFAFILWDAQKQSIFAARDHVGTRPLFYARVDNMLIVSSEIGSIRCSPAISTRLNEQAVGDYLVLNNVSWLDRTQTIFADITRIPTAHCLQSDRNGTTLKRYWLPSVDDALLRYRTEDEYTDHFLEVFKQAVKDRMRSKRIAIPLSGGMDSTSVAVMACKLVRSGEINAELSAITQVFDRTHPSPEAYYAGLVGRKLGLPHFFLPCDEYRLREPLDLAAEPTTIFRSEMPNIVAWTTSLLGKTALRGDGGDELLFPEILNDVLKGLSLPKVIELLSWQRQFLGTQSLLRVFTDLIDPRSWRKRASNNMPTFPTWLNPDFEHRFHLKQRYQQLGAWEPPQRHAFHPAGYATFLWPDRQMVGEPLKPSKVMAPIFTSPFLDRRLIKFMFSLPPQHWFKSKYLLRRAMSNDLPEEVLKRPKTNLGIVLSTLLSFPGTEWVDQWEAVPELSQYVSREAIPSLVSNIDPLSISTNIRPLMLNRWLVEYQDI